MGQHLRATWIASFLFLLGASAAAQEIKAPQISFLTVEWDAALAELSRLDAPLAAAPAIANAPASKPNLLARLNDMTGQNLPGIAASPVPVLLPLSLDPDLRQGPERGNASARGKDEAVKFQSEFGAPRFFLAGPAGYDASFTVTVPAVAERSKKRPARNVEIHISGMALLYELGERTGGEEKPPTGLQADFPDIRRFYFEGHMRYLFRRYGVLYSISIECFDGRSHSKRFLCNDAHDIATRFLKALAIAGGRPQQAPAASSAPTAGRPDNSSSAFTYYPPGRLVPGTGARKHGGVSDYTVYSKIRFPLAQGPAQTYSQIYINLSDCAGASGESQMKRRNGAPFRCPSTEKLAAAGAPPGGMPSDARSIYPWRDNFCEIRGYYVGQCPAGIGHQGQDIVPVDCRLSNSDLDQCERKEHALVAVRGGVVLRSPGEEGLVIVVNGPSEHLRFRYLHMNPKLIDEDGYLSGRVVREGEIIGRVGNYAGREGGTSYHLHFDMQVPTKDGWVLVNPYMTLVLAYERLIGARGTQLFDAVRETPVADAETRKTKTSSVQRPALSARKATKAKRPSRRR